jgi:hypothetical protein
VLNIGWLGSPTLQFVEAAALSGMSKEDVCDRLQEMALAQRNLGRLMIVLDANILICTVFGSVSDPLDSVLAA